MSPVTHLLASWVFAAHVTDNPRDCRVVTLAGMIPDADGLGIVADLWNEWHGHGQSYFYPEYHHFLLHGLPAVGLLAIVAGLLARQRLRVALAVVAVVHLHLLCDFVGSRGPSPEDLWPIFYFGPFDKDPMWIWKGQWRLDAWPNRYLSAALFLWALFLAVSRGYSFVGVFSRRLDEVFVGVLRRWDAALRQRLRRES